MASIQTCGSPGAIFCVPLQRVAWQATVPPGRDEATALTAFEPECSKADLHERLEAAAALRRGSTPDIQRAGKGGPRHTARAAADRAHIPLRLQLALLKLALLLGVHVCVDRAAGEGFDWATGEALAFGSLLCEGFPVRLSGQDCTRGTFSQRHSGLINQDTEERFYPLNHIRTGQKRYDVIDSMLSEYAVLGFEYGYSLAEPNALTLWEAQFGDFANGAQIMFDQFISSGESKWLRMSGLVVLLPHGFEGQGPEHSSARLERFLQMCGQDNWIIANCTTPANYFHILRRQLHRNFRKPLILMTPKSLLRHKLAVSKAEEFTTGSSFHRVLWDDAEASSSAHKLKPDAKIKRVVMCSGKVYYDLLEERNARGLDDIYLMRFEQFYPFPAISAMKELQRFENAKMIWCQEEPKNQGGWSFMEPNLEWVLERMKAKHNRLRYVGRSASASPATGLAAQHKFQQAALIDEALTIEGK